MTFCYFVIFVIFCLFVNRISNIAGIPKKIMISWWSGIRGRAILQFLETLLHKTCPCTVSRGGLRISDKFPSHKSLLTEKHLPHAGYAPYTPFCWANWHLTVSRGQRGKGAQRGLWLASQAGVRLQRSRAAACIGFDVRPMFL